MFIFYGPVVNIVAQLAHIYHLKPNNSGAEVYVEVGPWPDLFFEKCGR